MYSDYENALLQTLSLLMYIAAHREVLLRFESIGAVGYIGKAFFQCQKIHTT